MEVAKSPNDDRSYRALHLPNGLQVLLIHDPEIDVTSQEGDPDQGIKRPKGADDDSVDGEVMGHMLSATPSVQARLGHGFSDYSPTAMEQGDSDMGSGSASGSEEEEGGSGSGSGSEDEGDEEEDSPHEGRPGGKAVKRAAAALSVGIGHLSDPWQAQVGGPAL